MSSSYTVALWCADTSHLSSFAGAHLLRAGLSTANRGRAGDEIPVVVGVASSRRLPILSREVSARGLLQPRRPKAATHERFDYLLTFGSGVHVEAGRLAREATNAQVLDAHELVEHLDGLSPRSMPKGDVITVFNRVAKPPRHVTVRCGDTTDVRTVAALCQRLVLALNR
jgi:hypothetical protein